MHVYHGVDSIRMQKLDWAWKREQVFRDIDVVKVVVGKLNESRKGRILPHLLYRYETIDRLWRWGVFGYFGTPYSVQDEKIAVKLTQIHLRGLQILWPLLSLWTCSKYYSVSCTSSLWIVPFSNCGRTMALTVRVDDLGKVVRFPAQPKDSSSLQIVHTSCVAHWTSY
jgi:hypothetical protein